jgi:hypothetical protein
VPRLTTGARLASSAGPPVFNRDRLSPIVSDEALGDFLLRWHNLASAISPGVSGGAQ